MELIKKAEALQQNLTLLGLLELVIELCRKVESLEIKPEIKNKDKDVQVPPVRRKK